MTRWERDLERISANFENTSLSKNEECTARIVPRGWSAGYSRYIQTCPLLVVLVCTCGECPPRNSNSLSESTRRPCARRARDCARGAKPQQHPRCSRCPSRACRRTWSIAWFPLRSSASETGVWPNESCTLGDAPARSSAWTQRTAACASTTPVEDSQPTPARQCSGVRPFASRALTSMELALKRMASAFSFCWAAERCSAVHPSRLP
mmetsp:Transcript_50199/g.141533  ORF Transcript_50199/g.141533 Transcript_50199/m.141533 type:complete len:208 (+) Transcript_50199:1352-1975(+)